MREFLLLSILSLLFYSDGFSQRDTVRFTIDLSESSSNRFNVQMQLAVPSEQGVMDLIIPVWTPGYYQFLEFGKNISGFRESDMTGKALP